MYVAKQLPVAGVRCLRLVQTSDRREHDGGLLGANRIARLCEEHGAMRSRMESNYANTPNGESVNLYCVGLTKAIDDL
jgi:hypothetical protein